MKVVSELKNLLKPLSSLEKLMKRAGCPWMIIGGVASGLLGKPRFTADIDTVILIEDKDVSDILRLAEKKTVTEFARILEMPEIWNDIKNIITEKHGSRNSKT